MANNELRKSVTNLRISLDMGVGAEEINEFEDLNALTNSGVTGEMISKLVDRSRLQLSLTSAANEWDEQKTRRKILELNRSLADLAFGAGISEDVRADLQILRSVR